MRWIAVLLWGWLLSLSGTVDAYVEIPYSLGRVVQESTSISLLRVEKVDKERNLILFRKVQDLKGTQPGEVIRHNIGRGGFHEREWKAIMEWAEPGRVAVFFNNGGASETCIANYWYQAYAGGEWWNMSHGEPYMLRSFAGNPEKLATLVTAMVAGQEVVAPCMVDGDKQALQQRNGRVQRLRASLKIQDYNAQRDFAGWGGDDFRPLAGMPGFSHYAGVQRVDPDACGTSLADVDGDGKLDFCLYGAGRVSLLKVEGTSLNEIALPWSGGARSAEWADANGDGKPDLLLATPQGPKLLLNAGGTFQDASAGLPREPYYQVTAAAWIDYDGDRRPDILLANGYLGLRLYRNLGGPAPGGGAATGFADISAAARLGADGVAGNLRGEHLAVADVNGDGRADFLYGAGTGVLALNSPDGFHVASDSGIQYSPTRVRPAFGDFDGDGRPDLYIPQGTTGKLLANRGGRFVDVTGAAGELARPLAGATTAAWGDVDQDGKLDLVIGCVRGPNRCFRALGGGQFAEATDQLGLAQKVFNSRGIGIGDVNRDGVPDLVMTNEGQESAVLIGAPRKSS
ncbi:MAG: VCBS repeat-containing protein [Pirellulales bacterium]